MNIGNFYTCINCGESFDIAVHHICHSTQPDSPMSAPGYEKLAAVLQQAFDQAAHGKGKARHASDGVPFERQPMSTINMEQGSVDGFLYQARKKALEAKRLPAGRAQAELLGAIVYLAGAVIALDTWAADTLPQDI